MNLKAIEERVADVHAAEGSEFLFELLRAYGIPKASITRLRSGSYNWSEKEGEYLWRGKVYYRSLDCSDEELYAAVDAAKADERIVRERPRFAVARNENRLVAADLKTGDALDIEIGELQNYAAFFLPWAGIEKTQIENLNLADVKAAEKMAKLYDEITSNEANVFETEEQIHESQRLLLTAPVLLLRRGHGRLREGQLHQRDRFPQPRRRAKIFTNSSIRSSTCSTRSPTSAIGFPSHLSGVRLRQRQALRAALERPEIHGKGAVDCPRVRNAQLVPDQPRHLRLDDAGGRASRAAREPRDALHVGREHHEGDPATLSRRPARRSSTRPRTARPSSTGCSTA